MYDRSALNECMSKIHSNVDAFVYLDEVDSTNAEMLRRLKAAELKNQCVLVAGEQMAGRGRNGKAWVTGKNNIAMSLLWRGKHDFAYYSGLTLAIGCFLHNSLRGSTEDNQLKIKWPNDIYRSDCKVAGVLVESIMSLQGDQIFVIGVGVNLALKDSEISSIDRPVSNLFLKEEVTQEKLLCSIVKSIYAGLSRFEKIGLKSILNYFSEYNYLDGKSVEIVDDRRKQCGKVIRINENGSLRLQKGSSYIDVVSGSVELRQ